MKIQISVISIAILLVLLQIMTGCETSEQVVTSGPSLTVVRTDISPVIDGNLDDSCWSDLDSSMLVKTIDDSNAEYSTTVKFCYDDSCLYVGFECEDPDAVATVTAHDGPVYGGEHVALYVDADGDRNTYAVIEIAPNGVMRDAFVLSYQNGEKRTYLADWQCQGIRPSVTIHGGTSESETDDRFWTVELAIPFTAFVTALHIPPLPEDRWLVNAYRAETSNIREYTALAPTGDDGFHRPQSFVRFQFEGYDAE